MMKRMFGLLTLVLLMLVAWSGMGYAQDTTLVATQSFTLQPGGKATVMYEAYCIDFGQKFPTSVKAPNGVAASDVQAGMYYALTKGYQNSDPLELQYAIWELRRAENLPQSGAVAAEILDNAGKTTVPTPDGTSVLDAVGSGDVKLTLDAWAPLGEEADLGQVRDHYRGKGQITLENTSQKALTLYMPVGTIFETPDTASQNMASYATDVSVTNPALPNTGAVRSPALLIALLGLTLLLMSAGVRRLVRV